MVPEGTPQPDAPSVIDGDGALPDEPPPPYMDDPV